ncbi:hypothetical protein Godav_004296 [Gossypium davidsonii]|uniref:Uncharacterized protein n=3 Tax=Gossypium TaxID=3633 RepID=A0A7J8SKN7_GOSDV|nr:hypothetical protein [Gossypium davidsonii]MBA0662286.1 hypothetical protein [Gossypium klotzschianum]
MPTPESSFMPQDNIALENKAAEREACLIAKAEERFMKLTKIREAKFMDMMDAHEKKYRALLNECMAKGMSSKYKAFHSKYSKLTIL